MADIEILRLWRDFCSSAEDPNRPNPTNESSHIDSPKSPQSTANSFRSAYVQFLVNEDPDTLISRFLRARKHNHDKALQMFIDGMKWRLEYDINDVLRIGEAGVKPELLKSGKCFIRNRDKQHNPIWLASGDG